MGMAKEGKKIGGRGLLVGIPALVIWLVGALTLFEAEIAAVGIIPEFLKAGSSERKAIAGGPVYKFSLSAETLIPVEATVHLFTPPDESDYYGGKLRYYLYPRKVLVSRPEAPDTSGVSEGDYIILYLPEKFPHRTLESRLRRAFRIESVYHRIDDGWRTTVLRASRRKG